MKTSMSSVFIFVPPLVAWVRGQPVDDRSRTDACERPHTQRVVPLIGGHQRPAAAGDFRPPPIIYGQAQDNRAHSSWPGPGPPRTTNKVTGRSEPSKRPRATWRRFVYPAPMPAGSTGATENVVTAGRKVVIFQFQDDHSRLAVASLVASRETSQAAIDVFDKGAAAQGVPQRLRGRQRHGPGPQPKGVYRTPGGARALPRGRAHHLQAEPYHPTTQGTNEHFGQPLFRYLERQPLAASIAELQRKPRPSAARHRQDRKKASESTEIAKLRAEARGLHQENEFPKSSRFLRQGTTVTKRYNLNSREESHYPVTSMCRWSRVSKSGHYSWLDRPQSQTGHREEGSGHHD